MDDGEGPAPAGAGDDQPDRHATSPSSSSSTGESRSASGAIEDCDRSEAADAPGGGTEAGAGTGAGEPDARGPDEEDGRDPRRFNEWRKRSATGVVMSGIALGLREALELPDQRPALVIEAPGEPDDPDRPIDLHFDPDDPAATVAVVRHREDGKPAGSDPSA